MEQSRRVTLSAQVLMPQILAALEDGGSFVLAVTGGSMLPALKPGRDQVRLCAPSSPGAGKILLFRRPSGEYILHRVVKVLPGGGLRMNGDAQGWTEDIAPEQAVAEVTQILRKGKWHPCGTFADRCYAALWGLTRPVRGTLLGVYRSIRKLF